MLSRLLHLLYTSSPLGITKRERGQASHRETACGRVWSRVVRGGANQRKEKASALGSPQRLMSLDATRVALKAKLADKGRLRPHEMIRKKMPDGTGSLQDLPARVQGAGADDEAADGEYCKGIPMPRLPACCRLESPGGLVWRAFLADF